MAPPRRILLLFEKEWDAGGLAPLVRAREIAMHAAGFEGYVVVEGPGSGDHMRAVEEGRHYLSYLLSEIKIIYSA